jgi:hypothetical protein
MAVIERKGFEEERPDETMEALDAGATQADVDLHQYINDQRLAFEETPEIPKYRAYANGKHSVTLTHKQKDILRNLLGNKFCDNVCHQIISEAGNRITFIRWECSD